jgi:hypothetical protein
MNCHDVHPLLGVYVLGKADPDDRATVERHLPTCAQCREELAELEGLPALLARVAPPEPAPSQRPRPQPVPVTPSPDLLTRLLTAAAATRARRRRRASLLVAAAMIVTAGVGAPIVIRSVTTERPPEFATAPAQSGLQSSWSAADAGSGTRATVRLTPQPAGTALDLTLSGVPAGTRCALVVTPIDGAPTPAGSWQADYAGQATVTGFTATPLGQISNLRIVTAQGRTLLTITPPRVDGESTRT